MSADIGIGALFERRLSRWQTETRHHPLNKTCHHYVYHRLTCDEYDALRARAHGCCEICGIDEADTLRGSLVVDHFDQGDGRIWLIRGMICEKCNNGVMACMDGHKVWGANRRWEQRAREYEARSWDSPSPEVRAALAARTEMLPSLKGTGLRRVLGAAS